MFQITIIMVAYLEDKNTSYKYHYDEIFPIRVGWGDILSRILHESQKFDFLNNYYMSRAAWGF